jgi:Protein of unknown function (DUF4242)
VPEFLLELYVARGQVEAVERDDARARRAAAELRRSGTAVRYVRSIYIPEDETCFLIYEADTLEAVRRAASRASLPVDRILGCARTSGSR